LIPHSRPSLGDDDARAVARVVRGGQIAQGPEVAAFERELAARLGVPAAAAVSSGTIALELALRALDVGPGDDVVVPTYTCDALHHAIVRVGALHLGVGSALETKVLMRIRGATDDPSDDLVIEMRRAPPPSGGECAWRPPHGGSLQPLLFMSILGQRMPDTFGVVTLSDEAVTPEFWAQSWEQGYRELSIADIQNQRELVELAEDAARQLAGHFWTRFPEPLRPIQRRAQLRAFDLVAARALTLARELAAETVREWSLFRQAVAANPALSRE